jgi:CRP-like cAMP-binding protein
MSPRDVHGGRPDLVGPIERVFLLRRSPLLGDVPVDQVAALARYAEPWRYRRGRTLQRQGEPPRSIYIITAGTVSLRDRGVEVDRVEAPGGVGLLDALRHADSGLEAVAMTDTQALVIDHEVLLDLYEDHFPFLLSSLRILSGQIIDGWQRPEAEPRLPAVPEEPDAPWTGPVDLVGKLMRLRRTPPFLRTSLDVLGVLAQILREASIPAGTTLWRRGDKARRFFLVVRGTVVYREGPGRVVQAFGPDHSVGVMEGLAGRDRVYDAVTARDTVALEGAHEGFIDVLEDDFDLAMDVLGAMAETLTTERLSRSPVRRGPGESGATSRRQTP